MLDVNAIAFLGAATNLARLHEIFKGLTSAYQAILIPESVEAISRHVSAFKYEAEKLGARLACVRADRLISEVQFDPCQITVAQAVLGLNEIESRFADYLIEIQMFALNPQETTLLESADDLIEQKGFSAAFPTAAFEVEEAAKCIAFGRHTASVFHAMRMLEVGIRALAKRIGISDPTKPAEKNWSFILKSINEKIEESWPKKTRIAGSEGSAFEELYAHLDAVRNPWRNATMHVETIYAPHEALHIIRCSAFFLKRLFELTDENGIPPRDPSIPNLEEPN